MITIFNGRRRSIDGGESVIYAQVDVLMRDYLYLFRQNNDLNAWGVFTCIALHCNEDGWAWPTTPTIKESTGLVSDEAITRAIKWLRAMTIMNNPVLHHYRQKIKGQWGNSYYHVFPLAGGADRQPVSHLVYWEGLKPPHQPGVAVPVLAQAGNNKKNQIQEEPDLKNLLPDGKKRFADNCYYAVSDGKKIIYSRKYSEKALVEFLNTISEGQFLTNQERWQANGVHAAKGSDLNSLAVYKGYDIKRPPMQPRKDDPLKDALAIYLGAKAGDRTSMDSKIGIVVKIMYGPKNKRDDGQIYLVAYEQQRQGVDELDFKKLALETPMFKKWFKDQYPDGKVPGVEKFLPNWSTWRDETDAKLPKNGDKRFDDGVWKYFTDGIWEPKQ